MVYDEDTQPGNRDYTWQRKIHQIYEWHKGIFLAFLVVYKPDSASRFGWEKNNQ